MKFRVVFTGCFLTFLLSFVLTNNSIASATQLECIPLEKCPLLLKLIKKRQTPESLSVLRTSHCGFIADKPKVWCPLIERCKTPDSHNGTCTNINDCDSFIKMLENMDVKKRETKTYLRKFKCSTRKDSNLKVCCVDKQPIKSRYVPRTETVLETNQESCGQQSAENKIVGGVDTELNEYPWLALFKYVKDSTVIFGCSGSLIGDRYVLTAAHCVDSYIIKTKDLGKLENVILGEYDIRNNTDCIYSKYGMECADKPQVYQVERYFLHPDFNSLNMTNDIAVVRLNRKVTFSEFVQPICLPNRSFVPKKSEKFVISGWGSSEFQATSFAKLKAVVEYVERIKCSYGQRTINMNQICAGNVKGVDSCYGDSGGPLMLQQKTKTGYRFFVIGIISYGFGQICGTFPGVYTFVPPFLNWIAKQTTEIDI